MVTAPEGAPAPGGWRAIGATLAGATHVRGGIPNQDSLYLSPGSGLPLIVAVSDGHGSPKCFRSHLGSRFAVGTAALALKEFLESAPDAEAPVVALERARASLPEVIARRWAEAVRLDLTLSPVTAEELARLEEKSGADARRYAEANPLLAYGATLLAAAITDRAHVFVQLGDGEILAVSDAKEVVRPLPDDARLFANETTSLSSPSAKADFRVEILECASSEPALVLLTTDGYANSFRDDEGFLKVGVDVFDMIAESGLDAIAASVESWLEEATRLGSGDDVTLVIACRTDAIRARAPSAAKEEEPPGETPPGVESATPDPAPPDQQSG